jgi:hypothetical protein
MKIITRKYACKYGKAEIISKEIPNGLPGFTEYL